MMNERQETAKTFLAILMAGVGLFLSAEAHAKTVKVEMTAVETEVVVDGEGTKYSAWTFNNQFPGPVIRVKQGDQVDFTLTNPSSNTRPHSMDFHAAKASFLTHYKELNPGESLHYTWEAKRPGIFVYHCGASPMIQHVARAT